MTPSRFAWILLTTAAAMTLNVAVSFLYVAVYAHLINPGQDPTFYQQYARFAAPYSSILAGAPIVFYFCAWIGRRWEAAFALKAALAVWLTYATVDLALMIPAGMDRRLTVLVAVSLATKLVAAYLAGRKASLDVR